MAPRYRGTDRRIPHFVDGLDEDHPANQLFVEYVKRTGGVGTVDDLHFARDLIMSYRQLQPPQCFEIIEGTRVGESPRATSIFLGYDLSWMFMDSLLRNGLKLINNEPPTLSGNDLYWSAAPTLNDVQAVFQPLLNENGLFFEESHARACLSRVVDVERIWPNLWDSTTLKGTEVVGVWLVP